MLTRKARHVDSLHSGSVTGNLQLAVAAVGAELRYRSACRTTPCQDNEGAAGLIQQEACIYIFQVFVSLWAVLSSVNRFLEASPSSMGFDRSGTIRAARGVP